MTSTVRDPTTEDAVVVDLMPPLRRFVGSLVGDAHDVDDVVQETLTRVLPARARLDGPALTGYAVTVARNLVHDLHRGVARRHRLLPRLVDRSSPAQPESAAISADERRALRVALDLLPADQRELMLAHDLHGEPLQDLTESQSTAAVAARLSRARARARVDYVVALRRAELPTPRCRPVLRSLSAGDRRRQGTLRAGSHIVNCATCADLAPALLQRDRALAGFLPWFSTGAALAWVAAALKRRPVQVGLATAGVATSAIVAAAVWPVSPAPVPLRAETPRATLMVAGAPLLPLRDQLAGVAGQMAVASGARVLAVPADEGFWVGEPDRRVWVQLQGEGESTVRVRAGDRVSFTGVVDQHTRRFAQRVGVSAADGAAELTEQRHHLSVDGSSLRVRQ